jgi:hypothetical protein
MNDQTLSLVKLAQELCNSRQTPRDATGHLLLWAHEHSGLAYLLEADQEQAIAELERRFSGYAVKPWDDIAVQLGYALESIRQLLALNADLQQQLTKLDGLTIKRVPSAVAVATRFLAGMEGGK